MEDIQSEQRINFEINSRYLAEKDSLKDGAPKQWTPYVRIQRA